MSCPLSITRPLVISHSLFDFAIFLSLSQTDGFIFDTVPAGLGDDKVVGPRLDRLARLGELITETLAASKRFAAKFFISSGSQEPTEFNDVPNMLEQATKLHKSSLKSAARGGAKTALGLFMAHYPEAEIEVVNRGHVVYL